MTNTGTDAEKSSAVHRESRSPYELSEAAIVPGEIEIDSLPPCSESCSESSTPHERQELERDGGYGWITVVCALLCHGLTWGVLTSFGIYLAEYLANDTFPGTTDLQYAFVLGISLASPLVFTALSNIIISSKWGGPRVSVYMGCTLYFAGMFGAAYAKKIWQLYLSQGLAYGIGTGLIFNVAMTVPPKWFFKHRGIAVGISTAGTGVGGVAFAIGTASMITNLGIGWSFRITAIIATTLLVIVGSFLKYPPEQTHHLFKPFQFDILKKPEYLCTVLYCLLGLMGYMGCVFSIPTFAISGLGFTRGQGGMGTALFNVGMLFGRPIVGQVLDIVGVINGSLFSGFVTVILALAFWATLSTYPQFLVWALLMGSICGSVWTTAAPLVAEVVPIKDLGTALSMFWVLVAPGAVVAMPIALTLRTSDPTRADFRNVAIYCACCYLGSNAALMYTRWWVVNVRLSEEERLKRLPPKRKWFHFFYGKWYGWIRA
ncbi:hypothetical protein CANCADRAFT_32724 [Tortispora caseinolytica NRRL Y-17796]|uniref:Major facilitator superfamily (MFS) profile domain-containing protein n=1 Tax=Tortispora caseinolytica NRRL Y-17796 TaxID=767744 RepID=A0A1E4TCK1_9ASCO|nr:hypothetical protein CANCADRAFT_32724 [Tortispora caseinolytica NRRL Y-17796]